MAKKDSKRLKAEQYYTENIEATQSEIAQLFGVRPATIGEWVKKYDWEEKRLKFHSSPTIIKQKLQAEAIRILGGDPPTFSADAIAKIMAALDRCDKQTDPVVTYKFLKELDFFISQTDPEFARACTKYHKLFLQYKINDEAP